MAALKEQIPPDWVQVIKLQHSISESVKTETAKQGEYLLGGKVNLSKKFIMALLGYRWHALLFRDGKKVIDTYDRNSDEYKEVRNTKKDFNGGVSPSYGQDWLVYLPEYGQIGSFFPNLGSRTERDASVVLFTHFTKPEERSSEAERNLIHTNIFEVSSTLMSMGKFNPWGIQVKALPPNPEYAPPQELYDQYKEMFFNPVQREKSATPADNIR